MKDAIDKWDVKSSKKYMKLVEQWMPFRLFVRLNARTDEKKHKGDDFYKQWGIQL